MAFVRDVYSSNSRRILFGFILLIYFCCSYSSASLLDSSHVNIDEINEKKDLSDEINSYQYPSSLSSLSSDYSNENDNRIFSQERLLNLLLKSARIREDEEENYRYRPYAIRFESRRNVIPQSFHAMRG